MIWEVISIIALVIGLIASILTIIDIIRNGKVKITWKVIAMVILVVLLPMGIYQKVEDRHNTDIENLRNEYLILDSEITSEINKNHTRTYSGYLSKFSLIVGFYKRHEKIYANEHMLFRSHYDTFKTYYDKKYINNEGIIFGTDINEIKEVVETGVNNIKSIIEKNELKND
jgi:hypothetical protein